MYLCIILFFKIFLLYVFTISVISFIISFCFDYLNGFPSAFVNLLAKI